MLDVSAGELQQVRQILLEKLPDKTTAYAFGSRTQNTARRFSDLDIVLMAENGLSFALLAELQEAFSESDLPYRIDLIDWDRISGEFKAVIKQQLVEI